MDDFSFGLLRSSVSLLTFRESLPLFFLTETSKPLQGSKDAVLQAPNLEFSQVSLSFFDQSFEKVLLNFPVSQQFKALFSLQIYNKILNCQAEVLESKIKVKKAQADTKVDHHTPPSIEI